LIFKEYGFVVRQRLRKSASDLHSEAADCRTIQGIKFPEEQISHTPRAERPSQRSREFMSTASTCQSVTPTSSPARKHDPIPPNGARTT
jgi:hypothetical protein